MTDPFRDHIAAAIRAAAYNCDGSDCRSTDDECAAAHPVRRPEPWRYVVRIEGSPEGLADAALATVRPELDRLAAEVERLRRQLWDVYDVCDQVDLELDGTIPPDDTTYGGVVTRIRNAAGFRPTRTVQES